MPAVSPIGPSRPKPNLQTMSVLRSEADLDARRANVRYKEQLAGGRGWSASTLIASARSSSAPTPRRRPRLRAWSPARPNIMACRSGRATWLRRSRTHRCALAYQNEQTGEPERTSLCGTTRYTHRAAELSHGCDYLAHSLSILGTNPVWPFLLSAR